MTISLRSMIAPFFAVLIAVSSVSACAQSADKAPRTVTPGNVAMSPDGTTLVWGVKSGEGYVLHASDAVNPDPGKEKLISPGSGTSCTNNAPVWSPDSQWLAYSSTCTSKEEKPGQAQLFLWSRATGESKQLTHVTGLFRQAEWAPDGKSIAFLFVENATRSAGALDAMKPWDGVIGEDGVEVQRVYGVDVASGKGSWLSPLTLHVYEFDWAPSSREIAYIAADAPGENNWWVAKLWAAPVYPGTDHKAEQPRIILDPQKSAGDLHGLQIAVPRWSPDGKRIALIGGLMSDQGQTGGDVWVVDARGGEPVDITPGIDGTASFEMWLANDRIGFVEERRGKVRLPVFDVGKKTEIPGGEELGEVSISGGPIKDAVSGNAKTLAFVKSGITAPPEVWVFSQSGVKQFTHLNDGAKAVARIESVEWENEGFHVQGWLTYPENYSPAKKYPMIVTVHGGPSAATGARWGGTSLWAQHGYFEFQPNPRGSFGQGEAFAKANRKDFGYGDLRDILAGVDAVEKKVSVDDKRLGITGWSYGGFMTMFAITQTHRFRAAVAGAGLSDWLSYYGENSIDQWMVPFFGASVYDDPAVYAKSSAINFIKNAKTPTLVIVGDRDGECPAPQSFEFWHALRAQGVKTQLVVYPNEGHGFRDPKHIADRDEREVKWFAENMPAGQ